VSHGGWQGNCSFSIAKQCNQNVACTATENISSQYKNICNFYFQKFFYSQIIKPTHLILIVTKTLEQINTLRAGVRHTRT